MPEQPGSAAIDDPRQAWADAIALQSFVYLYPLWEMSRMRAATATRRNAQGAFVDADRGSTRRWTNVFIHARELLGAGASRVVTPNNDTLYTNAWLDLSRGPVVIAVPDTADRYYVLGLLDFWTNPFAHIGRRTTGTNAGRFLVAGPHWSGEIPPGMTLVSCPTDHAWIIGRIMVEGPEDVPAVNALQDGFELCTLAAWQRGEAFAGDVIDAGMDPKAPLEPARFLAVVERALRENAPPPGEQALLADAWRLGLRAGGPTDEAQRSGIESLPEPVAERAWARAIRIGTALLRADGSDTAQPDVPASQAGSTDAGGNTDPRGGWSAPLLLGEGFGQDWYRRAVVAMKYIGALASEEAFYPMAHRDSNGRPLSGAHRYRIRFPAGEEPPVDAFWSLTVYDSRDFMLVPNPIDRYRIGDRSRGLARDEDGALTLWIQHVPPEPARAPNWLPAPAGRFYLCLRAYQPHATMLDGRYALPPIERVD